ncbi:hypothetical protein B5S28_g895 [[Candida] boidinii]|nr:hypothetical protein B5S28_g895 [[Candida] boidinii]OWB72383.1 hypothetical protein B5S31_g2091 [[Candida] boidinii]
MVSFTKSVLTSLALSCMATALIPIELDGKRFIKPALSYKNPGEVFFVQGLDYQPGGSSGYSDEDTSDVLSNADACLRDAYVLQQLNVNTIRIYTINPAVNHDACMSIFNAAGIYVILDVNSPLEGQSLNRYDPESSYNWWYMNRIFNIIDAFKGYPNVIGFFSGNEIINDKKSAGLCPKYIRAVTRDMKEYIANNADRQIPVGYSAADVLEYRYASWEYLQCNIDGDSDDMSKSDFYGLNSYEWCSGSSDWTSSGYDKVNSTFVDTTIPVFFSEYGCNKNSPRTFDEVTDGVFTGLKNTLSGGLIYEYSKEANDYGIVDIDESSGSLDLSQEYENLKKEYSETDITDLSETSVEEVKISTCNKTLIEDTNSDFDADFSLPEQPGGLDVLIKYGANNTNIGKIIKLNSTETTYSIYDKDGNEITDKSINVDDDNLINEQSDKPSSSAKTTYTSTSSQATSTVSSSSSKSKNGAVALMLNKAAIDSALLSFGIAIAALI